MINSIDVIQHVLKNRDKSKWPSLQFISESYGIGKNNLSRYNTGENEPSFNCVVGIIEMLGFDFCEVINEINNKH